MRRLVRFLVGVALGGGALAAYVVFVGVEDVLARAATVTAGALAAVVLLVVAESVVDGVGVWASVRPLNGGLSPARSVQFALAGDFFDTLSPAGPVTSEPVMARFIGVATDTGYSDALGVRSVAKYVKSGAQLLLSGVLAVALLAGGSAPSEVLALLGAALVGLAVLGLALVRARAVVTAVVVAAVSPVVRRVSGLYRDDPHGRDFVAAAAERFWARALRFRESPGLVALIALGGLLEQVLTAGALWVALAGTGTIVALVPLVAVVPVPQAASVVPVPASLGAYDVLLAGVLVAMTGAPGVAAATAVLVVRAVALPVAIGGGGLAVAFLRGWTP
ncbi:lysylphosphatidylglycerol synthase domain-containing protein [Halosegnis marinus]|uniref:Lysylphosphatidylglycerol synthase domain-containing protein n=1 Tax=Halosegnis marinus TaxID=3034023 RepID=A0ABD5ZKU8_9EURY|nr:lysylphosphatidylglycerol synthase domain-containing protein [Halosegnis sp. DT85]